MSDLGKEANALRWAHINTKMTRDGQRDVKSNMQIIWGLVSRTFVTWNAIKFFSFYVITLLCEHSCFPCSVDITQKIK